MTSRDQTQQQQPARASSKARVERGAKERCRPLFHSDISALRHLGRYTAASTDTTGRVRWLVRFYRARAYRDMDWNSDALCEQFGITERSFDDCFEMCDSDDVLAELVLADDDLSNALREHLGARTIEEWTAVALAAARQIPLL